MGKICKWIKAQLSAWKIRERPEDTDLRETPGASKDIHTIGGNVRDFVAFMKPLEDIAVIQYGFTRGIITAQAAHETAFGRAVIDKNLFNIKATASWRGRKVQVRTWEYTPDNPVYAYFRAYDTYVDSLRDYVGLVRGLARYQEAWQNRDNVDVYYYRLSKGGYATDPNYPGKCLTHFDTIKGIV